MSGRPDASGARLLALALAVAALLVALRGLERRNTWYLASDQFAFLTLASDMAHGRVLHSPDALGRLGAARPAGGVRDALYQTYFWTGERLYSRYPPGFPALLALASRLGGARAQHLLNPALFVALLALLATLLWRLLRAGDRRLAAGTALAATWLALVLPTQIHLWGITVARDLPAHLLGLACVLAATDGAAAAAGGLLGLACLVRPDAVLWGASAATLLLLRRVGPGGFLRFGAMLALGLVPLLVYNRATRGSPFAFGQGGEFDRLLSSWGRARFVVLAQAIPLPSGGGFRLGHFAETFPGNLRLLARAFSWTVLASAFGLAWSARERPRLLAAFAPYALLATGFYGFWSHPDARYLAGICLVGIAFAAIGAAVACRWASRTQASAARAGAVALAAIVATAVAWSARAGIARSAACPGAPEAALAAALVAAAMIPRRGRGGRGDRGGEARARVASSATLAPLFPAIALSGLVCVRLLGSPGERDPFQQEQVERARATIEAVVPAGALVLVGDGLGRPSENIAHYTHAESQYASELALLRTHPARSALGYALEGRSVFALVGDPDGSLVDALGAVGTLRTVEHRAGPSLLSWFVDPAAAPRGATLYEVSVSAPVLDLARRLRATAGQGAQDGAPPGR